MDRDSPLMRQKLVQQWADVVGTLERMSQGASVLPNDAWNNIREAASSSDEIVKFELCPVVFNVPEHANHRNIGLFVVAEGWIELSRADFRNGLGLVTHAFSTRSADFRQKEETLEHVYGAHYDVAFDELGHPTFHSQLRSFVDFSAHILEQFNLNLDVINHLEGVLRNVRLPTAQMDFFSLILQIFADHLLMRNSGEEEKSAFNALLQKNVFLRGAAARSSRLTADVARSCYRSLHWYPIA